MVTKSSPENEFELLRLRIANVRAMLSDIIEDQAIWGIFLRTMDNWVRTLKILGMAMAIKPLQNAELDAEFHGLMETKCAKH
jgi:hypothetical protein